MHHRFFVIASFSVAAALVVACSSSSSSSSGTGSTDSGATTDSGSGDDGSSTSEASTTPKGDGGDQQIAGSAASPTSCASVCTAAGLTCDPNYDWGTDLNDANGSVAAGDLEYHDPTDGLAYFGVDCTTVPPKTRDLSGSGNPDELGTLTEFDCACK